MFVSSIAIALMATFVVAGSIQSRHGSGSAANPEAGAGIAANSEGSALDASERGATAPPTEPGSGTGNPPCDTTISEDEAHRSVWALAEVRRTAEELRQQGVRPFTLTISTPDPRSSPGDESAVYTIYLGEDHGTHVVRRATFSVDVCGNRVSDRET